MRAGTDAKAAVIHIIHSIAVIAASWHPCILMQILILFSILRRPTAQCQRVSEQKESPLRVIQPFPSVT